MTAMPQASTPCVVLRVNLIPLALACCAVLAIAMAGPAARGEPADGKGATWSQIEGGQEYKTFRDKMRLGESLTPDDLAFLTQTLFPQLESPANRPTIDRIVRRKLRDIQLATDNPATLEQFTKQLADFMVKVARDTKKEPIVRVNAILLVGELNDDTRRRPWPGSVAPLVEIVTDPGIAADVRIAAAAGLQRHADAARVAGQQSLANFAAKAGPAVAALLAPPAGTDRAAADWMVARALTIVRAVGTAVPPGTAAAAVRVFEDASRPLDVRIRSVAAAAAIQSKDAEPAKIVSFAGAAALELLKSERLATAAEQKQAAAGNPAAAKDHPVRRQARRHLAWRLATLADAVFTEDTTGGMAALLADQAQVAAAKDLARRLRQAANAINDKPDDDSIQNAIDALTGGQPAPEPAANTQPKPEPNPPQPEPDPENPFKDSPFK